MSGWERGGRGREIHRLQLGKAMYADPGWAESLEASGQGWESLQAGSGAKHVGLDEVWLHVGGNSTGEEESLEHQMLER